MSNSAFSQNAPASSFADLTGVPDDNAALAAALAGKADTYIAQLSTIDGSHPPVVDGESNGLGGSPVWTSGNTGTATLTLAGAFAVGKVCGTASMAALEVRAATYRFDIVSANVVEFTFYDAAIGGALVNPSVPVTILITKRN
jgi:hypothetical protein